MAGPGGAETATATASRGRDMWRERIGWRVVNQSVNMMGGGTRGKNECEHAKHDERERVRERDGKQGVRERERGGGRAETQTPGASV